ncbi:hypothetical protein DOY81_009305 [Sarcophaga bullata]|nr:hypothetical protein DOY81_009305 [Sarcophaga bullata]
MSATKHFTQRKAPSSFISDVTDPNLMQLSPRKDQRSPYTITGNQESRTNFIGDSVIPTQIPRGLAVDITGEKYILDWDDSQQFRTSSNPFTIHSPRYSAPTMERISEKSVTDLCPKESEKATKSSSKIGKKSKPVKCHVNKKHRLVFTPRNLENSSSSQLPSKSSLNEQNTKKEPARSLSKINSTETQTDYMPTIVCASCKPRLTHNNGVATTTCTKRPHSAVESTSKCRFNETLIRDPIRTQNYYTPDVSQFEPLKIYTKTNPNLRNYSELRAIASVVTLITVISWLFSTFIDVECLLDYLNSLWQYIQNLCLEALTSSSSSSSSNSSSSSSSSSSNSSSNSNKAVVTASILATIIKTSGKNNKTTKNGG